uniref:Uncharacterized protein n=1 Tax=Ixodes ricinus TaxID=34613 RepID=A0A147BJN3_IXORI
MSFSPLLSPTLIFSIFSFAQPLARLRFDLPFHSKDSNNFLVPRAVFLMLLFSTSLSHRFILLSFFLSFIVLAKM